ncbi:Serine protease [Globisporangium polare]
MGRETVVRWRLTAAAASVNGSASQDDDDNAVESTNFLSYQSVAQSVTTLAFEMSSKEELRGVFAGVHDAC